LHADIPALRTMIETVGPVGRYRAIIFCEKEGMLPILQRARIPELCDVALMTTKGNTVTAARELVDELTLMLAALEREIPIIVLHDFDVMGLTIFSTFLKNTERYQYRSGLIVIDGGLRLAQAQAMQLQDESVVFSKTKSGKYKSPRPETLRENGATEEEIAFLIGDGRTGRRVELNAMTSDQFVASVKAMLEANDLNQKVVPHHADLEEAYRQMYAVHRLNAVVERAVLESGFEENGLQVPKALAKQ